MWLKKDEGCTGWGASLEHNLHGARWYEGWRVLLWLSAIHYLSESCVRAKKKMVPSGVRCPIFVAAGGRGLGGEGEGSLMFIFHSALWTWTSTVEERTSPQWKPHEGCRVCGEVVWVSSIRLSFLYLHFCRDLSFQLTFLLFSFS